MTTDYENLKARYSTFIHGAKALKYGDTSYLPEQLGWHDRVTQVAWEELLVLCGNDEVRAKKCHTDWLAWQIEQLHFHEHGFDQRLNEGLFRYGARHKLRLVAGD
jgi:hypothetical protein